jgi:hypothetical protein
MGRRKESTKLSKTFFGHVCIIHFDKSWDKCLALAEFSYNNSYQASLKMAPFEALYGRRCHTPLNWSQVGEQKFFGRSLVKEAEDRVEVIKENLKAAQMRQKSYHDKGKAVREYQVGEGQAFRLPTRVCTRVCTHVQAGGLTVTATQAVRRTRQREGQKGQAGGRARIVGSGTCRRKARLDGRHTSVGGRAVAAVQFNQSRHITMGNARFFPRLKGQHIGTAR